MPEPTRLVVRDTPVNVLRAGSGPPLLYLHGAGAGGRWLGFEQKLAEGFDVIAPTHPGHAGAPPAEWIEHISDLAFHYLDLMDTLDLPRVHLVGASLGGWVAAEMATFASHRLASLEGQIFTIFIITVAAGEAAVGLAIIIQLYRLKSTINVDEARSLNG